LPKESQFFIDAPQVTNPLDLSTNKMALRGSDRLLLGVMNVTKSTAIAPGAAVYAATTLMPLLVVGASAAVCLFHVIAQTRIFAKDEAPKIVLTSDYRARKVGDFGPVSTMYDWAKGIGGRVEKGYVMEEAAQAKQNKEGRIRAKRQRMIIDEVLGVIRENMTNLRVSASGMFHEFDADESGSLSYWEFTKGLERLDVKLSDSRLEMIMSDLDEDGGGNIGLVEFENALALNQ
jgi:hypothetical protein